MQQDCPGAGNVNDTFEPTSGSATLQGVTSEQPDVRPDWLVPAAARVALVHPQRAAILERHEAAVVSSVPTYIDPVSGFSVFTAAFLKSRNYCCDSGCRHCPYVAE